MLIRLANPFDTPEAAQVLSDALRPIPWHQVVYKDVPASQHVDYHAKKLENHIAQPSKRVLLATDLAGTVLGVLVYERVGMGDAEVDVVKPARPSKIDEAPIRDWVAKIGPWDAARAAAGPHILGLSMGVDPLRTRSGIASLLCRRLAQDAKEAQVPVFCESTESTIPFYEGFARQNGYRLKFPGKPITTRTEVPLRCHLVQFLEDDRVSRTA